MRQVGERIGCVLGSGDNKVEFLGFGIYEGDFVPKEAVGFLADGCRMHNIPNPRLKLDNGKVVYGCECWWGSEEEVKKRMEQWRALWKRYLMR